jgi:hypothetical protein
VRSLYRGLTVVFFVGHICEMNIDRTIVCIFLVIIFSLLISYSPTPFGIYLVKPRYSDTHHAGMPLGEKICKRHQKSELIDFELILFLSCVDI